MPAPLPPDDGALLWFAVGVLVAIGMLVGALVWLVLYIRRPHPPKLPPLPDSAAVAPLEKLSKDAADLPAEAITERLAETIAIYLHRRHGVPALYRTAVELSRQRSAAHPPPLPGIKAFAPLLERIESIKFASPHRQKEAALEALRGARDIVGGP